MPAATELPAGAPVAPPTISRADLLHTGQQASPWEFVPVAYQALEQQPGDEDVRLLLARHLGALGLRTAALEQLAALSARSHANPRVVEVAKAVSDLPDDRIPWETLDATCRSNVEALARRAHGAVNLRLHAATWRNHAAKTEWFRARNGNIVRRVRSASGRTTWLHLEDIRSGANQYRFAETGTQPDQAPVAPIVLEGLDPPWLFQRLCSEHPPRPDGYWVPITVIQTDPLELLDALAHTDLTTELSQPRVRFYVGPAAGQRFADDLQTPERLDGVVTGLLLTAASLRTPAPVRPKDSIWHASEVQADAWDPMLRTVLDRYASRDIRYFADRFASATSRVPGASPLRVLILTSRYSTFIKHSAADLDRALSGLGHSVRTVMEPDDFSWITPLAMLRAVRDHDPDLVVTINYPRASMPKYLPPSLPLVTWVQDAMPHLYERAAGEGMGPADFLVGNLTESLFTHFGYPRSRSLLCGMVASRTKFHAGPVPPALSERYACELAYVSHHSRTPDDLHDEFRARVAGAPALVAALDRLLPAVRREVADIVTHPLTVRLRALTFHALRHVGCPLEDREVSFVYNTYTVPVADRMIRHSTLAWAAELARERGWRLHLYGRGWEAHPELAPFARGELSHGEDLRASYRSARAHLQVSAHTIVHQRIVECVLSGGLPVSRIHADELSTLRSMVLAEGIARGIRPFGRHPGVAHSVLGYHTAEFEEGRALNRLESELGIPETPVLWLAEARADALRRHGVDVPPERDLRWLLGNPSLSTFATRDGMRSLLTSVVEDDVRRDQARAHLAARAAEHLTSDAFAGKILGFIAAGLAKPAEAAAPPAPIGQSIAESWDIPDDATLNDHFQETLRQMLA